MTLEKKMKFLQELVKSLLLQRSSWNIDVYVYRLFGLRAVLVNIPGKNRVSTEFLFF
jgi:hypothetical protein